VVKPTVFLVSSSREDLLQAWSEYERVYGADGPPSTLLGVAMLGSSEQQVEIEAVAVHEAVAATANDGPESAGRTYSCVGLVARWPHFRNHEAGVSGTAIGAFETSAPGHNQPPRRRRSARARTKGGVDRRTVAHLVFASQGCECWSAGG
jgi:hypothetical protein